MYFLALVWSDWNASPINVPAGTRVLLNESAASAVLSLLIIASPRPIITGMTQLILPLTTPPRFTFDTLVVHEGIQEAVQTIRSVYGRGDPPFPSLFLHGSPGTGKTHILHALAILLEERFSGERARVEFVGAAEDPKSRSLLSELASGDHALIAEIRAVIIDDVHRTSEDDGPHLWSLSNKLTRAGAALILSSADPPLHTFERDAHMQSRITSGLVFGLEPPDDAVRMLILDKMARDRNVRFSRDVSHYLVTRKSRNVKELARIMEKLDVTSLELQRRITVPLVKLLEKDGLI
jgi:DnaA-homolog protein